MGARELESAIRGLAADSKALDAFRDDPRAGAQAWSLEPHEADAILKGDRDALRGLGVNDGLTILVTRWFRDDLADSRSLGAFRVDHAKPLGIVDLPANLVFAGACSHVPDLLARPEIDPPDAVARLKAAYARLAAQLAAAEPDLLLVTTDCHFQRFETAATVIGTAPFHRGSLAFFKRPDIDLDIGGDPGFANHLIRAARDAGLEIETSTEIELDHGLIVPLKQMLPRPDLPVVPIVTQPARGFSPFGARSLGQAFRRVISESGRRVAVLGTGGLSHWLDPGNYGRVDIGFDTYLLEMMTAGYGHDLADLEPYPLLDHGQYEFMNWLIMLGILGPGVKGAVHAYEPMIASGGGWAVVEMQLDVA